MELYSGDAVLDRLAAQSHVGGKRLVAVVLLADVVLDVARHVELVAHVLELLVQHRALLHVHRRCGTHVRDHVLRLVGGDVGVHARQLALDHPETVVDEHRSGVRYLVLVTHPVLVIDGDQGVQDVLGTLGGHVLDRERDDVGVLVGEVHLESVQVRLCHAALAQDPHEVIFTEKVVDQLFRAVLVLVGGHGEAHPCGGDGLQHSGNAVIWSCEVAFVGIVVRNEYGGHPLDNFFRGLSGGDGDAEEVVDAAAYHLVVGLDGMGRKAALGQGVVGGVA